MSELTEWDIEQLQRYSQGNSNSGYLVTTKTGFEGRTYHNESLVNGKVCVYLSNGGRVLCNVDSLTIKGFID